MTDHPANPPPWTAQALTLTVVQRDVVNLLLAGLTYRAMALRLRVKPRTCMAYVARIAQQLDSGADELPPRERVMVWAYWHRNDPPSPPDRVVKSTAA